MDLSADNKSNSQCFFYYLLIFLPLNTVMDCSRRNKKVDEIGKKPFPFF